MQWLQGTNSLSVYSLVAAEESRLVTGLEKGQKINRAALSTPLHHQYSNCIMEDCTNRYLESSNQFILPHSVLAQG